MKFNITKYVRWKTSSYLNKKKFLLNFKISILKYLIIFKDYIR